MKIYKYAPIISAIKIINDGRLLLRNPFSFNDPFDNDAKRDKKDIIKVRKIMKDFTMATLVIKAAMNPEISKTLKRRPSFKMIKAEHDLMIKNLKLYPRFNGDFGMRALYKMLGVKNEMFKKQIEINLNNFEQLTTKSIEEIKKDALATCFSKRNDSILMWSHYANSHEGVCIEYERPETLDFMDVLYNKKRPKIKLEELISFMCALSIIGSDYNPLLDTQLSIKTVSPFLTKSIDWKYEEEVRCVVIKPSKSDNYVVENDIPYYKMPKPTKIYIGCRAKGKEMNELIKIAKKKRIKCVFLKCDDETFSLKER